MSHVNDLRKKTAQERLRGDHIDLLFQLEASHKLNDKYEKEISELKELLGRSEQPPAPPTQPDEHHSELIEELRQTIASLQNEVSKCCNENKTMKTKESVAEKSYQKKIENLQSQFEKSEGEKEKLKFELSGVKAASEEISTTYRMRVEELEDMLIEKQNHFQGDDGRELKNKFLALEKAIEDSKLALEQKNRAIEENETNFAEQIAKREDTYLKQKNVILQLEKEKSILNEDIEEGQQTIANLQARLTEIDLATPEVVVIHDIGAPPCPTITTDCSTQTDAMTDQDKEVLTGNHFKKYVQLKKENMTLKVQLAHKESSARRGSDSSGGGSRRNSGSGVDYNPLPLVPTSRKGPGIRSKK